jgi:predicted transcriptional regulator of viral defense system
MTVKIQTILDSLEEQLAASRRRVVSDWRAMLLLQQAMKTVPESRRRWHVAPANTSESRTLLQRLAASGNLEPYQSYPHLYRVISPYAKQDPIEEDEILMELHPYAALSHLSALAFHQVTNQLSKDIHASVPTGRSAGLLPVGTQTSEWFPGMSSIRGRLVSAIEDVPINWHQLEKFFGYAEYSPRGYPVRITTLEKTLIDGLAVPEWCGGLTNVLTAWMSAKDAINLKSVIKLTDRQDIGILRQRVGYVLEKLGFSDPELDNWTTKAKRGGSSKLLASAPFESTFSERWMLSLNASTAPIDGDLS